MADLKVLKLNGSVGFDTHPDQLVANLATRGFTFNLLCVGETGIGKSTLVNTLFNEKFELESTDHNCNNSVLLSSKTYDLKEKNVNLSLTVIETSGFGDQINKTQCAKEIIAFIDKQFEGYLHEELKIARDLRLYKDTRVHACLYFISPTGHSLKALDLITMKKLQDKVNLIPVIAKSDTITKEVLQDFKKIVLNELQEHSVRTYACPVDDPQNLKLNESFNNLMPFSVVGACDYDSKNKCRGRQYPWGFVQVDNPSHCDFVHLRDLLLRENTQDLRESTHKHHYELYRKQRLAEMGYRDDEASLKEVFVKRREAQKVLQQKKEDEMRQKFVAKVKEKEEDLKQKETASNQKYNVEKQQYDERKRELEERKRLYEEQLMSFERRRQSIEGAKNSSATLKKKK